MSNELFEKLVSDQPEPAADSVAEAIIEEQDTRSEGYDNSQQKRFFELAERLEQLDDERLKIREELDVVMKNLGLNSYHQDPQTGLVYKIEKPKGTFMYFRDIDYKRTAKPGERGGTVLSKKEAEEQGFTLLAK